MKDSRILAREHFEARAQRSQQLGEAAAEAAHQDEVSNFRADVIRSFIRHGALRGSRPWMLFELERREDDDAPEDVIMEEREILIAMYTATRADDETAPLIRLFSNQIVGVDGRPSLMAEDVTVDQFGDAQYMVDAVDNEILGTEAGWFSTRTRAVIFKPVEDQKMGYWNCYPYTPFSYVAALSDDGADMIRPYGEPDYPEDRNYAIYKAKELFLATSTYKPAAIGSDV